MVNSQRDMSSQFWQEVHLVIHVKVADNALHIALVINIFQQSHGVGCTFRQSAWAYGLPVATKALLAAVNGLCGVERRSIINGSGISKSVSCEAALGVEREPQVVVEERGREYQCRRVAFQLVGEQDSLLVGVTHRHAVRQHTCTA